MFWIAVKVLFFRQVYGFKHRWFTIVLAVVLPVILLSLFHFGRLLPGGTVSVKTPDPLTVVFTPLGSDAEQLINEAYRSLGFQDNSSANLRVMSTETGERMNQSLRESQRSIGVQFHKISNDKLEYTLHSPQSGSHKMDFPVMFSTPFTAHNDDLFRVILQLQAAIDTAYIRRYFPGHRYLRLRFPNSSYSDVEGPGGFADASGQASKEFLFVMNVGFSVSVGIILVMAVLASYIVRDKLSGVQELLCVNGVPRWMVSTSWLFAFCLLAVVIALCQLALLTLPRSNPVLPNINPFLLALLLIVYCWSALIFSNFVANLLTSQLVTILLICIYWFVTTVLSWLAAWKLAEYRALQALISLAPNFGFSMFLAIQAVEFHGKNIELSFGNIFFYPVEYISAGLVLLLMIVSILLFLALVFYLDVVKPGPFGRARPWYLFRRTNLATVRPADAPPSDEALVVQEIEEDVPIGLRCVNIVKMFGTYAALNNVNLNIIKNNITILLGHNGAGKTTLFSILCGMFSPTSGEVHTEEFNIFEGNNINRFRKVLGYCPQENLLLNELTVREHLIIFGMLKGLTMSEASAYGEEWTEKFNMSSMRHTQAKKLSGGFKRKLCLAIAMTGKPEYLLLDEPSAGMDIESTRMFCDLMLEEKGNNTVVITTHNMDEAEILGDRIAILAQGQVKCYGESSFLKQELDAGYRLNCSVTSAITQDVIKAVKRFMEDATVLYKTNHSVTFRLPINAMHYIPDLLRRLEEDFGGTISSTVSPSTLDDVFIEVQKDLGVKINVEELPDIEKDDMSRSCFIVSELLRKRACWLRSKRMVTVIVLVIVLPSLALVGDMFLLHAIIAPPKNKNFDNLSLSVSKKDGTFPLSSSHRDDISDFIRSTFKKRGISFTESSSDMNSSSSDVGKTLNPFDHRIKLLLAYDTQPDTPIADVQSRNDNAISTAYSALINALLRGNASIVTHRASWEPQDFKDISCPIEPSYGQFCGTLFALMILPFFLAASTYFLVFPHEERITLFKHLQLMTGLLPAVYWLANLLFDMMIYAVSCVCFIAIMATIDLLYTDVFLSLYVMGAFITVLLLYGLSSITLSYIWSFFFRASATAALLLFCISTFLTLSVSSLISFFPNQVSFKFIYFLPVAILWNSMINIVIWALQKKSCDQCYFPESCQYLEENPLFQKGLKYEMMCFAVSSVGYFLVLVLLDHGLGRRLLGSVQQCCFGTIKDVNVMDSDVAFEKEWVDNLNEMELDKYPQFVCNGLGKKYSRKMTAVYDVTFAAESGECFGLVGVNGAGKSTTFGMLAALLTVSKGTAVIDERWELAGCGYSYMKRVGYCPQSGGLLNELSARTILRLFGRLSGVSKRQIGPLVDQWIDALDMNAIANRPCGHYSGGNKRKLSLAVALIGIQPVVLLDEPTAGVDPVVRWRIWEILTACLERNEQTIILTSHTMSECEAICNRLTIMVKGVMQCLGPIPTLKQRFGKNYILEVKLAPSVTVEQQTYVQAVIESRFAGFIELQDSRLNRLVFSLKTETLKIYDLFDEMVRIKSEIRVIEYFNLSETPLEQVFLMFARHQ